MPPAPAPAVPAATPTLAPRTSAPAPVGVGAPAVGPDPGPALDPEGSRPLVTVLFADVVGSTTMGERLDPEDVTALMNAGYERLLPPITAFGGTVARLMGDGLLALFGAPTMHEDDPERAVRAALAMQAAAAAYRAEVRARFGLDYQIRIGINTGPVIAGHVGSRQYSEYTVMGDTVNTAARLESAAPVGGVRVGPETYRLTRHVVEYGPVEYLTLKGKAEPFPTYCVLAERTAPPESRRRLSSGGAPFLGRDAELARLTGWLLALAGRGHAAPTDPAGVEAVSGARGSVAAILGEAGLGKTRLIAEARRAAGAAGANLTWATTRCASFAQENDYGALATLLRELLGLRPAAGAVAPDGDAALAVAAAPVGGAGTTGAGAPRSHGSGSPAARVEAALRGLDGEGSGAGREIFAPPRLNLTVAALGDVLGYQQPDPFLDRLAPEYRRNVLLRSLGDVVAAVARRRPLVLVVEDAHWLDQASAAALDYLRPLTAELPLLILYSLRADPGAARALSESRIELAPLEPATSRRLLEALTADRPLPPRVAEAIIAHAEGNPFFLEELAHTASELVGDDGLETTALPATIQELLMTRLDGLAPAARRVAQTAAVLGREFPAGLVRELARTALGYTPAQTDDALRLLLERALLETRPDGALAFRQTLLQELAYTSLLRSRRRVLHTLAGRAIEALYPADVALWLDDLARHFGAGEDDERAVHFGYLAAERAAHRFQNERALRPSPSCSPGSTPRPPPPHRDPRAARRRSIRETCIGAGWPRSRRWRGPRSTPASSPRPRRTLPRRSISRSGDRRGRRCTC